MPVSGRAGLFTIDDKFFYDLRGTPYTAEKRQKSGALRLEFGKVYMPNASNNITVKTTVNTGICAVVCPTKTPTVTPQTSSQNVGAWNVATSGSFLSGTMHVSIQATGQFSGQQSGMEINYIVIGY